MHGDYETKENDFRKKLSNSTVQSPPLNTSRSRTPLNTISDPSQTTIESSLQHRKATTRVCNDSAIDFEIQQDPSFWIHNNVQVLVRIRPVDGQRCCLRQESSDALVWLGHPETRFTFDHVASHDISQENLFRVAGFPMVENCMSGYNSCIFAYGQTGSGKTYTMMGEINNEMECGNLSEYCGITPRVFQYLFTRISAEEENRRDEKLKYSCKCSFLEIYNEQITDILEPSSTNLQLREDLKKGVYVENLTEYDVLTVTDVVKLLVRGAANRKMAATNMNSESSRSHSVFTCIIESCWEKDSVTHFRFARLNLVDLAGSERQKSSGAEGDRLKEAANINKSLSTLGLVIMSLVDLAQGKQRHVPYRDSRLTFLLQDSLGGNSKTMIIANVSPSISSVNESLSTLKFAQRAKLIQNNAKVNEDASGDVFALQQQIQHLKGQLSYLLNHHNLSRFLSCQFSEECNIVEHSEQLYIPEGESIDDYHTTQNAQKKVETILLHVTQRELETSKTTLHLQEEIAHLPLELQDRVCGIIQENFELKETVAAQEDQIRAVSLDWERATIELTNFLIDGSRSLKDASSQIEGIAFSFPQVNDWISEQVERAAKACIEKEETILLLQNSLEDAQNMVKEMEPKLCFLRIATMALKQAQQLKNEEITMLPLQLSTEFDENIHEINDPDINLKHTDDEAIKAEFSREECPTHIEELERKEAVLKGLLFDFTLLQESASNTRDIKDENEKLVLNLDQVQQELEMKTRQLNDILTQHRKLEATVFISNSELDQAREMIATLSDKNVELRMELKDLYFNKSEVEEQLEELKDVVKGFENELLRMNSPIENNKFISSFEDVEDELSRVASERDQLREEVYHLTDKLEMAHALAEENEAVAVEARQELEASKIHAEQKEEEVMILERSVEELESTIDVLEKKVYEMDEELERYKLIRDSLELELQALTQRMLTVEKFSDSVDLVNIYIDQGTHGKQSSDLQSGRMEVERADDHISVVKEERAEQDREIKQLKEYISEILLHAEAQASQYQQKYKTLEAMVHEVQADSLNSTFDKTEKRSTRTRGSGSPFRCIASMVQQTNVEKDQELSIARLRIQELEALAASRQNEVCVLKSRLALTENMIHDVNRDLLGVKVDMTNYANLIDHQHVQKLVEDAQQQTEGFLAKEQEILNLREQICNLMEDRESCISELNRREEDMLAAQLDVEQLQERDQLLIAQNEMLKMDKINLKRKIAELDEMVKCLNGKQNIQQKMQKPTKTKEENMLRLGSSDISKRLAISEKILSGVNDELAQYRKNSAKPSGSHPPDKSIGHSIEKRYW